MKKDAQRTNEKDTSLVDDIAAEIRKKLKSIGIPEALTGTIVLALAAFFVRKLLEGGSLRIRYCFKASSKRECLFSKEIGKELRNTKCVFVSIPYINTAEFNYRNCVCDVLHELEYTPVLAKDEPMGGDISCNVCRLIQKSRFIVVDISGANPNVFHELGIAQGISRRVFLIKHLGDASRVPSNIQSLKYLRYGEDIDIFKDRLSKMIKETLARD